MISPACRIARRFRLLEDIPQYERPGGEYMSKQKKRTAAKWKRYEAEKRKLAWKGLPAAQYEQAIKQLARKYRL